MWLFGPVTWRWGDRGNRNSITVFGAFLTFPLAAWNVWTWNKGHDLERGETSTEISGKQLEPSPERVRDFPETGGRGGDR